MSTGEPTKTTMEDLAVLAESAQVTDMMRMLDRTARANEQTLDRHRQIEEAQAEKFGVAPAAAGTGEDNMNVYLNSPITYNPKASMPTSVSAETSATVVAQTATTPFWQKALLAAALALGSAGVGALIPWLAGAFDKAAPAATFVDTDTDTQYELQLGTGETP